MSRFRIPTLLSKEPKLTDNKTLLEIIKIVEHYPNNMELGKIIRTYINNLDK
jgi:hypothetical protein